MKPVVLVTGSSGLIGSRFLAKMASCYDIVKGDITDGFDILNPNQNPPGQETSLDFIVHLAAFTDVSGAFSQKGDREGLCYRLNVTGTENMIALANQHNAHLIHISTDFVFDGESDDPISEEATPNPIEWYGETKLMAEEKVRREADRFTLVRIAFPYHRTEGVRPDLVAGISQKLRDRQPLYLFGDQMITPTFADDVVDAIGRFIDRSDETTGECFHVTGPESMSPYELGIRLARIRGLGDEQITETSLVDYLKKDPRPRQRFLTIDTNKYKRFCAKHNYEVPLSLESVFEN